MSATAGRPRPGASTGSHAVRKTLKELRPRHPAGDEREDHDGRTDWCAANSLHHRITYERTALVGCRVEDRRHISRAGRRAEDLAVTPASRLLPSCRRTPRRKVFIRCRSQPVDFRRPIEPSVQVFGHLPAPQPLWRRPASRRTCRSVGPRFQLANVAIHAHLLPTGKVLYWGRRRRPATRASLRSMSISAKLPLGSATGQSVPTKQSPTLEGGQGVNLFCSGHSFLPSGELPSLAAISSTVKAWIRPAFTMPPPTTWTALAADEQRALVSIRDHTA